MAASVNRGEHVTGIIMGPIMGLVGIPTEWILWG